MQTMDRFVLTFVINSLWQTTLVVGIAACCARLMRNVEARYQHIVWVAALLLGLVLPLTSPGRMGRHELASRDRFDRVQVRSSVSKENRPVTEPGTQAFTPASGTTVRPSRFARLLARIKEPVSLPPFLVRIVLACYLVWVLIQSLKLARALKTTSEIRRSAEKRALPEWMESIVTRCQAEFGLRRVTILYSSRALGPITVGARQPVIVLPERLFEPSAADDLTAALGHEMAHIRRHDFALNLLYELLYLTISFHPAARLVRRRIGETREVACDEVLSSPDPALSDAAVNAFKEWRYKPTLLNGHPVEVVTTLAVEFRLNP